MTDHESPNPPNNRDTAPHSGGRARIGGGQAKTGEDRHAGTDQPAIDALTDHERRLLSLLELPHTEDPRRDAARETRIAAIAARCLASATNRGTLARVAPDADDRLAVASADEVDAFFNGPHHETAPRASAFLALLDTPSISAAERRDRVERTHQSIEQLETDRRRRLRISPPSPGDLEQTRRKPRFADIVALAAMIVLGASLFSTIAGKLDAESARQQNQANLSRAGFGIGLFANDHDGRLPSRRQPNNAPLWWAVGDKANSHSANLFTLVDQRYTPLGTLASPTNRFAPTTLTTDFDGDWRSSHEVSYSYQLFRTPPRLSDPALRIVLGDRSPLAQHAAEGLRVNPLANSRAHAGAGQHLLATDGSVEFTESPVIESPRGWGGDNIWLPGPAAASPPSTHAIRFPASPTADVFLAP